MLRCAATFVSAAFLALIAAGCAEQQAAPEMTYTGSSAKPPMKEVAVVATPSQQPKTGVADGRQHTTYAYPTGHEETSVLLIERDLPTEIVAGQEFYYDIKVTNINHVPARAVTVRDECATGLTVLKAEPKAMSDKQPLVWALGDLNPGESRTVHVVGKTTSTDPFTSCASATYNETLCLTAAVVRPALKLTLAAPAEATPCDTIPVKLTVMNTGSGTARNVHIAYPLPEGWTTQEGKATAQFALDELAPNQSRDFTINATAPKTGEFSYKATATADSGLKIESAPAATTIRQAVLGVKAQGPEHVFAGQPVTLKFAINNTGTGPANKATFEVPLPAGLKFVSATDGGVLANSIVSWKLDPIAVKATKELTMIVEPGTIGGFDVLGTAKAYCAAPVSAPLTVAVFGIPALLLEVSDLKDPVEVNGETTYLIVVTNQGSATATNVRIVADLESNEKYLSAVGGKVMATTDQLTFEPIASIPPKESVTLKVTVKCTGEGDTRFKVTMTSDQLKRPVEETESTTIYR